MGGRTSAGAVAVAVAAAGGVAVAGAMTGGRSRR